MNLAGTIREHAASRGDEVALRYQDEVINYRELWQRVEAVATWLYARGIRRGDRVGLSMSEHPRHLLAHFAVARLEAVIVPMDHRWTGSEKRAAADAFGVRVVMTDDDDLTVPDDTALPTFDPAATPDDHDLLISLSSGTTGRPKGALLTHANLYERFVSQWQAIGYGADDCFAVLTPFYFGAGRSFGMSLLAAGGTVLIAPPPLKPPQIIATLQQSFITATFLPPTLLRRLFEFHGDGDAPLFDNLNYLIVSGEPLYADEAHDVIARICQNLYSYYASSEGGGISVLRPEDFEAFAATVGKPTYKTDVEIVDDHGGPVAAGVVGRLRYRGPGVSTRNVDADGTEHDSGNGGWFYPGDLAEQLPSGHIALRGRDKDVIIRGGVNIYPAEIEAVLLTHPGISEVAVFGVRDSARGEVVRACFSGSADSADLGDWCKARLAPYKVPQQFVAIDELPKRASGKVDKVALRERSTR